MTFEEFESNLKEVRKYSKKLAKMELAFFDVTISNFYKENRKDLYAQIGKKYRTEHYRHSDKNRPDQHELQRRIRGLKAAEMPEHIQKFRTDISAILISIIETDDEEPEETNILGESSLPFDAETNKTFKILKDYYINGYEISHINKRFNYTDETQENRRQVNYQLKIGRKKLYQIYKERSQNNGNQQAD